MRKIVGIGETVLDIIFRKNHLGDLDETFANIEENCRLCSNFICTQGAGPVEVFTAKGHRSYPVEDYETVSTIGAGDNFNAGFLYSLLAQGIGKEDLTDISEQMWDSIVSTAGKFSENVCKSIFNYVDEDFAL